MSFSVVGASVLIERLKQLPLKIARESLGHAVESGAEPIADAMGRKAPRGDPAAPNVSDIVVALARKRGDERTAIAYVGPVKEAFWGIFQEFGTRHHKAQPFARPALDEAHEEAQAAMARALWSDLQDRIG